MKSTRITESGSEYYLLTTLLRTRSRIPDLPGGRWGRRLCLVENRVEATVGPELGVRLMAVLGEMVACDPQLGIKQ